MRALMIIDVQQAMFSFPGLHEGKQTVARIADLLARARAADTPIFFVQHDGGAGDPFAAGTSGFQICAEITPRDGESVTVKKHRSSFKETDLDQKLKRADIDHLIICGMQSEFCVDTAVRSAIERGYAVTLVSDGHTTFDTKTLPAEKIIAHHNVVLGPDFANLSRAEDIEF